MFIVNTAVTIFYITTSCRTSVGNCKFGVNHFLLEGLKACLPGKYSNSLIKRVDSAGLWNCVIFIKQEQTERKGILGWSSSFFLVPEFFLHSNLESKR